MSLTTGCMLAGIQKSASDAPENSMQSLLSYREIPVNVRYSVILSSPKALLSAGFKMAFDKDVEKVVGINNEAFAGETCGVKEKWMKSYVPS